MPLPWCPCFIAPCRLGPSAEPGCGHQVGAAPAAGPGCWGRTLCAHTLPSTLQHRGGESAEHRTIHVASGSWVFAGLGSIKKEKLEGSGTDGGSRKRQPKLLTAGENHAEKQMIAGQKELKGCRASDLGGARWGMS